MLSTVICEDPTTLHRIAAELMYSALARAVADRGLARVALSGGSTPRLAYCLLAQLPFDRERTHWFWVDERGVPPSSERNNFALARDELLAPAQVAPNHVFRMTAEREPITLAAADYAGLLLCEFGMLEDRALELDEAGRSPMTFDLIVAGIGADGHTASLFPGTGAALHEDALVVPTTAYLGGGGNVGGPETEQREPRLSLTRPVLVAARRTLVLVAGEEKRAAVIAARQRGSEDEVPARVYQRARPGTLTLLLDRAAAGG
jgi:6-phosphogluconolactonase